MNTDSDIKNEAREDFRYILVGNIIGDHYYGENKELKNGTKHFRAGAKIYLLPEYGGMGHENIPVYGLPRKSWRKIRIVIRAKMITNVRVKKTFDPKMIEKVAKTSFYSSCDESILQRFADSLNSNNTQ